MSEIVIEAAQGIRLLRVREVWEYRELLAFLVWRDLKVRYKQTAIGVSWILLQPVLSVLIFSFIFGTLLKVPSYGVPYPLFAFGALLPWNYFANSLSHSAMSLVDAASLITKVYFPRVIVPLSAVISGLIDFAIAFLVVIGLMVFYGVSPSSRIILIPPLLFIVFLTSLGFGLWFSALNIRYRDVKYIVPFLTQIWFYATPVIYGIALVPERFRFLLSLNPMTLVVEGFRWALFGNLSTGYSPTSAWIGVSSLVTVLIFVSGMVYFHRTEHSFADIV